MEEKIIRIEKVVFGGKGLSRDLEKITFVPFTLPGEKVRVRIKRDAGDYYEAEAVEVVDRHADRVAPACRYFGRCGGCQLSHTSYERQIALKISMLQEALQRMHVQAPDISVIASSPFEYRHKAQLKWNAGSRQLGFYEAGTNKIVDIGECVCLTPALNALIKKLRATLLSFPLSDVKEIECFENDKGETAVYVGRPIPTAALQAIEHYTRVIDDTQPLRMRLRNYDLPLSPNIFLQNNRRMWQSFVMEVESHFPLYEDASAVELYCGAGFFTVPLSNRFSMVYAVEENREAIEFARNEHSVENVQWICETAENYRIPADARFLVVDPPRAGLTRKVAEKILTHPFEQITYVSCDCSSLARDLRTLSKQYKVERVTLIDLFPQTYHFETVCLLKRAIPIQDKMQS